MTLRDDQVPGNFRRLRPRPAVAMAAIVVAGVFAGGGCRRGAEVPAVPESAVRSEALDALREESLEMEQQFDEEVTEGVVPTAEQLQWLEQALAAQRDLLRVEEDPSWPQQERARILEVKLANARGRAWSVVSERFESEAAGHAAAGDYGAAGTALREALRLQREINVSAADPAVRRPEREVAIVLQIESIDAEPLARDVDRLETEARAALAGGNMKIAGERFASAADAQRRINHDFARTRFASTARLEQIEMEMASLGSIGIAAERDALIDQAAARDAAGVAEQAGLLFGRARDLQERINREFPQSRFASQTRRGELEIARQTALSRPRVAALVALDGETDGALRARRFDDARRSIATAQADLGALEKSLPLTRLLDVARHARLEALARLAPRLEELHAGVLDKLRAVPGTNASMLETEIPQRLYVAVMETSPGRATGDAWPAVSPTAEEAQEFCRRMSWVLARPVRLPTRAEFVAALGGEIDLTGSPAAADAELQAVDAGAPNAAGFRFLRGNVAEWVTGESPGEMLVAEVGRAAAAGPVLFRACTRTERRPNVGFRVVVE